MIVSVFGMRNQAVGAVLDSLLGIAEIAAAFAAQSIQRTKAKQAVEMLTGILMTGEILTFSVFKIVKAVFHHTLFSAFANCLRSDVILALNSREVLCRRTSKVPAKTGAFLDTGKAHRKDRFSFSAPETTGRRCSCLPPQRGIGVQLWSI